MTRTKTLTLLTIATVTLAGCVAPDDPQARQKNGMIVGGILGAAAANTGGPEEGRFGRTLAGAAVGAALGGVVGYSLDQQAAELRGSFQNPNISVTNYGNYLVVNMPQDLLFATDSATLSPTLTNDLRTVAASLVRYPQSMIEVVGHTDDAGAEAYNQDLSQRRAWAVANVLATNGVPTQRLAAYGRGESQPIASNRTAQGMAQNRRVEIIIRPTR